jgi:hypothetical protein
MKFTDRRAFEIAAATQEIEAVKQSLTSATAETLPGMLTSLQAAIERKERALAMPAHAYECLLCGLQGGEHKQFESAARTIVEVRAIITHDAEGNIISEEHFRQEPLFIVVCPGCTTRKKVKHYLKTRWQKTA